MKTLELFSGTESFSKVARERGHQTFTVDIIKQFKPNLIADLTLSQHQEIIFNDLDKYKPAVVWMSPVCTMWSLSAGNTHWTKTRYPKTEKAHEGIIMMLFCRAVADWCIKHKKIFFIENPNGRAVWILDNQYLKRCWYCQYGDSRAKPTNIWTNLDIEFRRCSNNNPDCNHIRAKRGSKTGTQGLKNSVERSMIPSQLFEEIFDKIEDKTKGP